LQTTPIFYFPFEADRRALQIGQTVGWIRARDQPDGMPTIGELETMSNALKVTGLPTPRSTGIVITVGHRLSVFWEDDNTW
jgi:hypothetical protein